MEAKIPGKWETDEEHGKNKNFEEYQAAIGMDPKMAENFKTIRDTLDYTIDGNTMTCKVIIGGNVVQTYENMERNKEMSIMGMDGKPCLYSYRFDNDKWIETYKPEDGKGIEVHTTKVINGNKMTITHDVVGKNVKYTYTATRK
ncbi:uncharacterized protein [Argopecten irradians]|uniref:uncharacterized protein n=1 Tax=Argopecten irradians TaxID=31199 RepID=UPI00371110DE